MDRKQVPEGVDGASAPTDVEVRPARRGDARQVVGLIGDVAAERRFIRTEGVDFTASQLRRQFRRSWTVDGAEIVAVADGRVVGHLGVSRETHPVARHVASLGMAVAKRWRGRGVGSALMSEVVRWGRWAGVEKLSLSVYPHNDAALSLYRKFGFEEEGVLRGHSKKSYGYEDEVVMARWL